MKATPKEFFAKMVSLSGDLVPGLRIAYKTESRLMGLLAVLLYPFNRAFMQRFTTTIGKTVYFPDRASVDRQPMRFAKILAHEDVHMFDESKSRLMYKPKYLYPQALLVVALALFAAFFSWVPVATLLAYLTLAYVMLWVMMQITDEPEIRLIVFGIIVFSGLVMYFWSALHRDGADGVLAAGVAFLPLVPWSAPGRAAIERRGYSMNIAFDLWTSGAVTDESLQNISKHFTGSSYYMMDRDEIRVMHRLMAVRDACETGDILIGPNAEPFRRVHDLIKECGMFVTYRSGNA